MTEDYRTYLNSLDWKAKCTRLFQLRGKRCEICNSSYRIHVHHLTYKNIFNEPFEDLQVLCFQCHRKEHYGNNSPTHISNTIKSIIENLTRTP